MKLHFWVTSRLTHEGFSNSFSLILCREKRKGDNFFRYCILFVNLLLYSSKNSKGKQITQHNLSSKKAFNGISIFESHTCKQCSFRKQYSFKTKPSTNGTTVSLGGIKKVAHPWPYIIWHSISV